MRGEDHARRAEAALQPVLRPERLLQRRAAAVRREPLDGGDARAVGLHGEHRARLTATPSMSTVQAPHWLVSQPILVPVSPSIAQEVDEQQTRLDVAAGTDGR